MTMRLLHAAAVMVASMLSAAAYAAPQSFDLGSYAAPPVMIPDSAPRACTVAIMVEDYVANETYAQRMTFESTPDAVAVNGRLPCPGMMPPKISQAALDACRDHAAKRSDCVFADMSRGFASDPRLENTSESAARCQSDQASQVAVACWNDGKTDVCNVACGDTPEAATQAARNRCEQKHQRQCNITGTLPVLAP